MVISFTFRLSGQKSREIQTNKYKNTSLTARRDFIQLKSNPQIILLKKENKEHLYNPSFIQGDKNMPIHGFFSANMAKLDKIFINFFEDSESEF